MSRLGWSDAPWFDELCTLAERRAVSPAEVVPAFFDGVVDWIIQNAQRGEGFIATTAEMPCARPSQSDTREQSRLIESYFATRLAIAGLRRPREAAAEAYVLLLGSIGAAVTRGDARHARRAAVMARRLVADGGDAGKVSP